MPRFELRVSAELLDRVEPRIRDLGRGQSRDDLLGGKREKDAPDHRLERLSVGHPVGVRLEARVDGRVWLFEDLGAETHPFSLVLDAEEDRFAVTGRKRTV